MQVDHRDQTVAHAALLSVTLAVVIRTAWMSNDAVNTLRSAVNFIHGYGPVVHLNERVQYFAHPLWFLLISAGTAIVGNAYAATFALSIILSLVTMWLLIARMASNFWAGILAGAGLLLSKAYVDFSASGLENPLAHFLLLAGMLAGLRSMRGAHREIFATLSLTLLIAIYLCRPELLLAVAPLCGVILWQSHRSLRQTLKTLGIAVAPVVCWSIFSRIYYGAVLPNLAAAKIAACFSNTDNFRQGIVYLLDSFSVDPLTLTFIGIAIALSLWESVELKALAAGIVAYLAYVLVVGGDPMSGRMLTVPLLAAAIILSRATLSLCGDAAVAVVFVILGSISSSSTIFAGPTYSASDVAIHGIRDERGAIFPHQSLATAWRGTFRQPDEWMPHPASEGVKTAVK